MAGLLVRVMGLVAQPQTLLKNSSQSNRSDSQPAHAAHLDSVTPKKDRSPTSPHPSLPPSLSLSQPHRHPPSVQGHPILELIAGLRLSPSHEFSLTQPIKLPEVFIRLAPAERGYLGSSRIFRTVYDTNHQRVRRKSVSYGLVSSTAT